MMVQVKWPVTAGMEKESISSYLLLTLSFIMISHVFHNNRLAY